MRVRIYTVRLGHPQGKLIGRYDSFGELSVGQKIDVKSRRWEILELARAPGNALDGVLVVRDVAAEKSRP